MTAVKQKGTSVFKRLLIYSRPYWWRIAVAAVASIGVGGMDAAFAYLVEPVLSKIFSGKETGIFMLLFLDLAYEDRKKAGLLRNTSDLKEAIHHGAVQRIRPKMMTAIVLFAGLMPILLAQSYEVGADVMKRIATPMVGGIVTSFLMELLVYPAIYFLWKKRSLPSERKA